MRYLDEDAESGYQKVWLELQAMGWNNRPFATACSTCTSSGSTS